MHDEIQGTVVNIGCQIELLSFAASKNDIQKSIYCNSVSLSELDNKFDNNALVSFITWKMWLVLRF